MIWYNLIRNQLLIWILGACFLWSDRSNGENSAGNIIFSALLNKNAEIWHLCLLSGNPILFALLNKSAEILHLCLLSGWIQSCEGGGEVAQPEAHNTLEPGSSSKSTKAINQPTTLWNQAKNQLNIFIFISIFNQSIKRSINPPTKAWNQVQSIHQSI